MVWEKDFQPKSLNSDFLKETGQQKKWCWKIIILKQFVVDD